MVELKLETLEAGLPKDCYLSVRVGEVQKLSRLSGARSFKFPSNDKNRFGKIEIFRRIGSHSVDLDPSFAAGERDVKISLDGASKEYVPLKVVVANGGASKQEAAPPADEAAAKTSAKAKAAKEYLGRHQLEVKLAEAMQAVLRERPEDPVGFLVQKLSKVAGQAPLPLTKDVAPKAAKDAAPKKDAPKAAPAAAQGAFPLTPFGAYHKAHFGTAGSAAMDQIYAKFPAKKVADTKTTPAPQQSAAPPTAPLASFKMKPSVGTWIMATPVKVPGAGAAAAAPKDAARPYVHKPSVGTWLMPVPPAAVAPKPAAAAAPAAAPASSKASLPLLPSIGTWAASRPAALYRPRTDAVRCLKGLQGGKVTPDQRVEAERVLTKALLEMAGEYEGEYFPLKSSDSFPMVPGGMSTEQEMVLAQRSLLFKPSTGDATGRGVFVNNAQDLAAWVNEDDKVRFVVFHSGAAAEMTLKLFQQAVEAALKQDGYTLV